MATERVLIVDDEASIRYVLTSLIRDMGLEPCAAGSAQEAWPLVEGPPLAAALDTRYEQWQVTIDPGEFLLLFSDGLPEARSPQGEAFGTARVQTILARQDGDAPSVVDAVLSELRLFTGKRWTQQDDLTVLVVERDHYGSSSARQT